MSNKFFSGLTPGFRTLVFSGSRNCPVCVRAAMACFDGVLPVHRVLVGDASGVDTLFADAFPSQTEVFYAASFGVGKSAFARRSVAVVRACSVERGLFCSFPSGACPASIVAPAPVVSRCFCGGGSGSWASLAFAVGLGCACFVSCPSALAPSWLVSRATSLGGGSWFVPAVAPVPLLF